MHRARDIQRACSRSQAWLRQALESGLVGIEAKTTATASSRFAARQHRPAHQRSRLPRTQVRPFSATRTVLNDVRPLEPPSDDAPADPRTEMEMVVRQARATFGDTLPKDFLSAAELKLYERLFGSPIRETRPEDVGLPLVERELNAALREEPTKNTLFREGKDGALEEVAYKTETTEEHSILVNVEGNAESTEAGASSDPGTGVMAEGLLTETHIQYIQASARNEREFTALAKLQRDFVVTQIKAKQEERAEQALLDQEYAASVKAQQAKYIVEEAPEEEEDDLFIDEAVEEELDEDEIEERDGRDRHGNVVPRVHALTLAARSRTQPSTIQLPKTELVQPIIELLKRTHIKHVKQAAETAFGGRELPNSPRSPAAKPGGKGGNFAQGPVAMQAGHRRMSDIEADAFIATVLPAVYASAMSTLVEVRRRLGPGWIEGLISKADGSNPRVLDVGGAGAGLAAWNQVFWSEVALMREKAEKGEGSGLSRQALDFDGEDADGGAITRSPTKKSNRLERTVVVGSDTLRHRVSTFLHNTTFIPRLPDLLHSAENAERHLDAPETPRPDGLGRRKTYDVILVSHALMPLGEAYQRRQFVDNLWAMLNPNGGVIIFVEKGHPRGFEAVADVRQRILDRYIVPPLQDGNPPPAEGAEGAAEIFPLDEEDTLARPKEPGMIVAPCTNHSKCPMYLTPGASLGRKDFCHFSQRFNRPPFLQRILGRTHHNHEDLDYSYIAVQRGTLGAQFAAPAPVQGKTAADAAFAGFHDAAPDNNSPHTLALPRTLLPPLKRHGHVVLDVCTPAGQIERWTVPKSSGRQAYHDARKLRWGDLWALGAKTRVVRPVRLGRGGPGGGKPKERILDLGVGDGKVLSAKEKGADPDLPPMLRARDRKKFGSKGLKKRNRSKQAQSILDEVRSEMKT